MIQGIPSLPYLRVNALEGVSVPLSTATTAVPSASFNAIWQKFGDGTAAILRGSYLCVHEWVSRSSSVKRRLALKRVECDCTLDAVSRDLSAYQVVLGVDRGRQSFCAPSVMLVFVERHNR